MSIPLSFRQSGDSQNPSIILLHGLLGSSRNWTTIAKALTDYFSVYTIDARNHGNSPHDERMSFEAMEEDFLAWLDSQGLDSITLLGHSMGGKTAMAFTCHFPERVRRLIVVDIAPRAYASTFLTEMKAMAQMNLDEIKSRRQADEILAETVTDWAFRQFLLTNLERDPDGQFRWQVNLPVLIDALTEIRTNPLQSTDCWAGETLFIKGGQSDFIKAKDEAGIYHHFPDSKIVTLEQSGHNPHIESKEAFLKVLFDFCI